jgi:signal transduction histidine kinase
MNASRWAPTWLVVGLAFVPLVGYFTPLSAVHRDLLLTSYGSALMVLGAVEAFRRTAREPALKWTWRALGVALLLAGLAFGRQALRNLMGAGLPTYLPMGILLAFVFAVLLLLLVVTGFNHAESRSRHPWNAFLDGAVFTVGLNQVLWMWVLQPIVQRAGLPGPYRVGVLLLFGMASAEVGLSLHVMAKRGFSWGPLSALTGAFVWLIALLPWWVQTNFLQQLRPAHPFRLLMLGALLLLWLVARLPWRKAATPQHGRPWVMNVLPYVPAGMAFLGAFLHDLLFGFAPDRLNILLLRSLAFLVLIRQVVAFHEIWNLKQSLEAKVEARTRELAESSRLLMRTQRMNLIATLGAGVAHDLNNLIGAALLNLDLMESEPPAAAPFPNRSWTALRGSLTKAAQLTQRLMAFGAEETRPDDGVELSGHLRSLQPILRALVPAAIRLEIDCVSEPLFVPGNAGLIDQVVVNLVMNARDATPAGGTIRIKAEPLPAASAQRACVCLSVADSGTGIPPEHLARIFEPFFSTKEVGKGTGLGLGSVKAVMESLGGSIQVHSVVGQGSRFSANLPRVIPGLHPAAKGEGGS